MFFRHQWSYFHNRMLLFRNLAKIKLSKSCFPACYFQCTLALRMWFCIATWISLHHGELFLDQTEYSIQMHLQQTGWLLCLLQSPLSSYQWSYCSVSFNRRHCSLELSSSASPPFWNAVTLEAPQMCSHLQKWILRYVWKVTLILI